MRSLTALLTRPLSLRYDKCVITVNCAGPGCTNLLAPQERGRPARFCSTACRVRAHRHSLKEISPAVVEVNYESTSSKGRKPERAWLVQLRRDNQAVIIAIGLSLPRAQNLAEKIANLLQITATIPNGGMELST